MRRFTLLTASLIAVIVTGCPEEPSGLTQPQVSTMLGIQSSVVDERLELARQADELNESRDDLEDDRREWAEREYADPIIAEAIGGSVLLIACLLPLIVTGLLLWPRNAEPADEAICSVLIDDLSADQPQLLPDRPSVQRIE